MTLILTLGNSEQVIQVSDRRLSCQGRILEDESSKAGFLSCPDARLAFGFTGLARYGDFRTRDWLLDALMASGRTEFTAIKILEGLRSRASEMFRLHPALCGLRPTDRRLSIMFSGYLDHHSPPLAAFAILTNYQNFNTGPDEADAWDEFRLITGAERRPLDGEPTLVQRVGNWQAMTPNDEFALRNLLREQRPPNAIVGKAVKLVRQMADRPAAAGTIGKQLSVIQIPRDHSRSAQSGYHSMKSGYVSYLPDQVIVTQHGACAQKDAKVELLRRPEDPPCVLPKVGRNHPCPCGSGKKYKRCCRDRETGIRPLWS